MSDSQPVHQHVYESICVCVRMPIPGFWIHYDPMKPIPWFASEPKKPSWSIISPKKLGPLPPQTPSRQTIPCQFLKLFFEGGVDPTKNNSRQLDELQRITGGKSRNIWRFGSVKSISRYPCEGQQVEGWEKKLLAGWNCWVTFPSFCALVLRDVWSIWEKVAILETDHVLIYVSMKLGDHRQRPQYMQ